FWEVRRALGPSSRKDTKLSSLVELQRLAQYVDAHRDLTANQILDCGCATFVPDVGQFHPSRASKENAGEVRHGTSGWRPIRRLFWIGLRPLHQVRHRLYGVGNCRPDAHSEDERA